MVAVSFSDRVALLRAFVEAGLILDPWLAGLGEDYFAFGSQELLYNTAAALAAQHWHEPLISASMGTTPMPERMAQTAAHEILVSTAATVGHEQRGKLHIAEEEAATAITRLQGFILAHDFGAVVQVYGLLTFVENHIAVRHYGGLPVDEFVRGRRHRPWVRYSLEDELLLGVATGIYALAVRQGQRWVTETAEGEHQYQEARGVLETSGYLARRLQLITLSQFNHFADWDTQAAKIAPSAGEYRRAFTGFAGLEPGMAVLEAGCGMASQTFEGGLWQAVGPIGSIVGIDPAAGMLERAEVKVQQHQATNVRFVRARAEDLSVFGDGSFDAAVGLAFLHFTEAPIALRELRRVTRPGGLVVVGGPCHLALDMPWFVDWFRPLLDLAKQHHDATTPQPLPGHLPAPGELREWFLAAGLRDVVVEPSPADWVLDDPELSVAFLIQGLSFFQRELELLPWQARQELVEELKQRGAAVCARTTAEERTIHWPAEFVKGTAPPA